MIPAVMNPETSKSRGDIGAAVVESNQRAGILTQAMGVVGFALATAVCANVQVPLPGTPVPMTLQTLCVLLAGVTLGPRLGLLSMAFYLLLGTTGYHAFAGGAWGLTTVAGATGGYLIGFVLAQPALGQIAQNAGHTWRSLAVAVISGNAVIFGCGLTWLWIWSGGSLAHALAWGLWPFVPGLVVKSLLAIGLGGLALRKLRPLFGR
jgi:biotin transport system substrate-specific component